jgi:glucokinase
MSEVAAGIDIGGTKIAVGLVDEAGALVASDQVPTLVAEGPDAGIARAVAALDALLGARPGLRLRGVGVGCAGPLDAPAGIIQNEWTLPGWEGFDALAPLRARYGVPARMENDADVAALGEAWCGAGAGIRTQIYITVSTGVGMGLILNGRLYRGSGSAGELGYHVIQMGGRPHSSGRPGCLEALASGTALAELALEGEGEGKAELLRAGAPTGADVTAAARAGNPFAQRIVREAARALAVGVGNVVVILAPDAIVLGGGVMTHAWDLFSDAIDAEVAQASALVFSPPVPVLRAALASPGLVGAARLVWQPDIAW